MGISGSANEQAISGSRRRRADGLAASAILVGKPGIAFGVAVSGFAGMTLAARGLPSPGMGMLCLLCIVMAASGSAILNVVFESESDKAMPRVDRRTTALVRLGEGNALALSAVLVITSVMLSFLLINMMTGLLILAASLIYTILYTLYLKKRSPYGTVPGGIPGALPVLIGYASVRPGLGLDGLILFLVMLLWQPPHFLALALKYKDEYKAAGLPVMPVAFGEPFTKSFIFIYASALPLLTTSLWLFGYCSANFACFAFLLGCFYLMSCYRNVVATNRYGRAFAASIVYIMFLMAAIVVDMGVNR